MHLRYSMPLSWSMSKLMETQFPSALTENDLLTFEPLEPTHSSPYSEGNIHQK